MVWTGIVINWKQVAQMDRWSKNEMKVLIAAVVMFILLPLFISEVGIWWSLAIFGAGMFLHVKNKEEKERKRDGKGSESQKGHGGVL